MSAGTEERTRSQSTKRANETGAEQSSKSSKANHTPWQDEHEEEIGKRRDLQDKMSDSGDQLSDYGDNVKDIKLELEKYRCATARLAEALVEENNAAAGTLTFLVKEKSLSMRELLSKWQVSRDTYGSNNK